MSIFPCTKRSQWRQQIPRVPLAWRPRVAWRWVVTRTLWFSLLNWMCCGHSTAASAFFSPKRNRLSLPTQNLGKNERRNDGGIRFDDESWRIDVQFAPGNFFVGHCAGVRSEAGGRIADLAKVTPLGHRSANHVLVEHGHNANRKIAGNTASNLEKANRRILRCLTVPIG